jgi:hydrogenase small subunit
MGCKGPVAFQNCPVVRWNEGTNWPIGCGHPCIGCSEPNFWDSMTPFYQHLDSVPGFQSTSIDRVGLLATAGVAAAFATHGFISLARRWRDTSQEHRESKREEKGDES